MEYFDRDKIEQYYPGAYMIPPMKAWKLPKNKQDARQEVFTNGEYFAELKMDGGCYTFENTSDNAYMFSRTVSTKNQLLVEKSDRVPHLVDFFTNVLPRKTVVALELVLPGGKSKDVTSITGCLAPKAIQRQKEKGFLIAYVHDILILENENLMTTPAIDRIKILRDIIPKGYENVQCATFVENDIDEYLRTAWHEGHEGIILKKKLGRYYPDKRPAWEWIKFKIEDDFDILCTGFYPPNKQYTGKELDKWQYWEGNTPVTKPYAKGWIGSLGMGCFKEGQIFEMGSVASGLTEELLEKIKVNPNAFLMKPMRIKAMETTSDYKLREPKFIEFREDINPEDCTFTKIFQ